MSKPNIFDRAYAWLIWAQINWANNATGKLIPQLNNLQEDVKPTNPDNPLQPIQEKTSQPIKWASFAVIGIILFLAIRFIYQLLTKNKKK